MKKFIYKLSGLMFFHKVGNMKQMKIVFLIVLFFMPLLNTAHAAISLPWSTTYNCADWNTYTDPLNCDGLEKNGSWTAGGHYEQITSAANNPAGGGGKGQRHWVGDGTNINSGGTSIKFATPVTEFRMRWYIRYQSGFAWNPISYDKLLWIHDSAGGGGVVEPDYGDNFRLFNATTGLTVASCSGGCGWNTMYPGGTSNGSWHYLEVHIKASTNGSNGIFEYWLDGVQKISVNNINISNGTTFDHIEFPSNQATPANGGYYYIDLDDVAINNTGFIGPVAGGTPPLAAPLPPVGLIVQ